MSLFKRFFKKNNNSKKIRLNDLRDKPTPKIGLIATSLRSGTWYARMFFFGFDKLLRAENPDSLQLVKEFEQQKERFHVKDTLGLDYLLVGHSSCPGFSEHYSGSLLTEWNNLKFYGEGVAHEHGDKILLEYKKLFDPYYNKNSKIVYFYRNPLDQAVAAFRDMQNHKFEHLRFRYDESGQKIPIKDAKDWIFTVGLTGYIKQFFTFKEMQKKYPKNIIMISYENLVRNPQKTFGDVLEHFGYLVDSDEKKAKIEQAIMLASKENLKKVEEKIGRTLANSQTVKGESQIRGGAVGKWKEHFTDEDLNKIENKLAVFNLSLKEFVIE